MSEFKSAVEDLDAKQVEEEDEDTTTFYTLKEDHKTIDSLLRELKDVDHAEDIVEAIRRRVELKITAGLLEKAKELIQDFALEAVAMRIPDPGEVIPRVWDLGDNYNEMIPKIKEQGAIGKKILNNIRLLLESGRSKRDIYDSTKKLMDLWGGDWDITNDLLRAQVLPDILSLDAPADIKESVEDIFDRLSASVEQGDIEIKRGLGEPDLEPEQATRIIRGVYRESKSISDLISTGTERKVTDILAQTAKFILNPAFSFKLFNKLSQIIWKKPPNRIREALLLMNPATTPTSIWDQIRNIRRPRMQGRSRNEYAYLTARTLILSALEKLGTWEAVKAMVNKATKAIQGAPADAPEGGALTTEFHIPSSMNYNGPGTQIEKRLQLGSSTGSKGSGSKLFPKNLHDLIAFEHDLLYATHNPVIRQLADIRYTNNLKSDAFLQRVNKYIDFDIDKVRSKYDLGEIASGIAISAQSALRSVDPKDVLRQIAKAYLSGGEDLTFNLKKLEFESGGVLNKIATLKDFRKYAVDNLGADPALFDAFVEGREDKLSIGKYDKFIDDVEVVVKDMYKLMGDNGYIDSSGEYVLSSDFGKFKGDLTQLQRDYNVMSNEQNKIDGVRGYATIPTSSAVDIDNFINKHDKIKTPTDIVEPIRQIEQIDQPTTMATHTRTHNITGLIEFVKNQDDAVGHVRDYEDKLKQAGFSKQFTLSSDEIRNNPTEAYEKLTDRAWDESSKTPDDRKKLLAIDNKIDRAIIKSLVRTMSPEDASKLRSMEAVEAGKFPDPVLQSKAPVTGKIPDPVLQPKSPVTGITPADNVLNASKAAVKAQPTAKTAVDTPASSSNITAEIPVGHSIPPTFKKAKAATRPVEVEPAVEVKSKIAAKAKLSPEDEAAGEVKSEAAASAAADAAGGESVVPDAIVEEPVVIPKSKVEPKPEGVGIATLGKDVAPDNMIDITNPIGRIVDKLMGKSSAQEREEMRALLAFITPPDQTGGLGTSKTNPLIKDNAEHLDRVLGDNLYKDTAINHLRSNTSELVMTQKYSRPQVEKRMRDRRSLPSRAATLERKVPVIFGGQVQSRRERDEFTPSINPPSGYAEHPSAYRGYYEPNARQGNPFSSADVTEYWRDPNTSFAPIRYQNP